MTQPSEQKNIMTRPFTGIIHFKVTKGIQLKSGITMVSHASEVLSTKEKKKDQLKWFKIQLKAFTFIQKEVNLAASRGIKLS